MQWSSQSDWDNAQSRSGVVTRDIGVRNPDEITIGADPDYLDNIVGYWPLDETSGSTATDVSGNGNDGTINGPTIGEQGPLSTNSYSFAGGEHTVDVPYDTSFDAILEAAEQDFTISFWINPAGSMGDDGVGVIDWEDVFIIRGRPNHGYDHLITLFNHERGDEAFWEVPADSGWTHVCMVFPVSEDFGVIRAYFDGEEKSQVDTEQNAYEVTDIESPIHMGQAFSDYMDGNLSDVILFSDILSEQEIQELGQLTGPNTLETAPIQASGPAIETEVSASIPQETATANPEGSTTTNSNSYGLAITPSVDVGGLELEISDSASGYSRCWISDESAPETLIAETDVSGVSTGEIFSIDVSLTSGTQYYVWLDNDGSDFTTTYNTSPTFTHTSNLTIDSGAYISSSFGTTGTAYNYASLSAYGGNIPPAATMTVSQDTTLDGTAENTETVELSDGTNTYSLSNFEAAESEYWVEYDLPTPIATESPQIQSTTLTEAETGEVFQVYGSPVGYGQSEAGIRRTMGVTGTPIGTGLSDGIFTHDILNKLGVYGGIVASGTADGTATLQTIRSLQLFGNPNADGSVEGVGSLLHGIRGSPSGMGVTEAGLNQVYSILGGAEGGGSTAGILDVFDPNYPRIIRTVERDVPFDTDEPREISFRNTIVREIHSEITKLRHIQFRDE